MIVVKRYSAICSFVHKNQTFCNPCTRFQTFDIKMSLSLVFIDCELVSEVCSTMKWRLYGPKYARLHFLVQTSLLQFTILRNLFCAQQLLAMKSTVFTRYHQSKEDHKVLLALWHSSQAGFNDNYAVLPGGSFGDSAEFTRILLTIPKKSVVSRYLC